MSECAASVRLIENPAARRWSCAAHPGVPAEGVAWVGGPTLLPVCAECMGALEARRIQALAGERSGGDVQRAAPPPGDGISDPGLRFTDRGR